MTSCLLEVIRSKIDKHIRCSIKKLMGKFIMNYRFVKDFLPMNFY